MVTPEQIKAVRKNRLKETQDAFGARFGVDQTTVHRWETDGLPATGAARMAVETFLASLPILEPATETRTSGLPSPNERAS